ncbi:Inner nuclear membrane protein Man1 [Amphibalanus amphitrite]|uniref:Inner nuclear membrane protein Man1 n=1 Tax=Amphibalanus amphitrite TaxID=1232801 RepID=A0A6A4X0K8_AMPAM|nr:Inner nuclear membrane protein Man1 [Amphibalanus amphitrite]
MLSDAELRDELVRLGANPGPITASTRHIYQKKLMKLLDASKSASNGISQSVAPDVPSNGHEQTDELTDSQLRQQLQRLGHNPGPISPGTRGLYLKKLAKLRASATADFNGHGLLAVADGVGAARRPRPPPARQPEPEPAEFSEPMDEVDQMDDSETAAFEMDESDPGAFGTDDSLASQSPVELGFGAAVAGRYDSPAAGRYDSPAAGRFDSLSEAHRPAGRSPMLDADPPQQPAGWSYRLGRSPLFGENSAPTPPARRAMFREDPVPPPTPPIQNSLFREEPAPTSRGSVPPEDPLEAVRSRYRPESLGRTRLYPETLYPRGAGTRLPERRPTPAATSDWRADPSPVTRAEQPPAERPGSLRQRDGRLVPAGRAAAAATAGRRRLRHVLGQRAGGGGRHAAATALADAHAAALSERNQAGFQSAPAHAHGASHLVPYCILLVAVLFFGLLGLSYLRLSRTDEAGAVAQLEAAAADTSGAVGVFPICGDPELDDRGCVLRERLEPAVQLLADVQPALVAAARDALCGRRELAAVPLPELAETTGAPLDQLRDLAVLVAYNAALGLRAEPLADGDGDKALSATGVSTPWLCLAGAALAFIVKWAFLLAAAFLLFLVLRAAVLWRRRSQQQQQQQLYQMVENIMEVVRRHTFQAAGTADKPYVAVDHVRDELLTPADRSSRERMALWERACQFIRDRESRLREECVLVAGESHTVWRWLPGAAGAAASAAGGRDRRRVWLGQAFQTSSGVNAPVHTRTNCLKIRHMFDPSCETASSGWQQDVRDALLEKCDGVAVMHIAVDDRSTEGLVYVNSLRGRLVSVKFIREERYHERYPDAAGVTVPLRPSNGLRRSLADLPAPASAEDD